MNMAGDLVAVVCFYNSTKVEQLFKMVTEQTGASKREMRLCYGETCLNDISMESRMFHVEKPKMNCFQGINLFPMVDMLWEELMAIYHDRVAHPQAFMDTIQEWGSNALNSHTTTEDNVLVWRKMNQEWVDIPLFAVDRTNPLYTMRTYTFLNKTAIVIYN